MTDVSELDSGSDILSATNTNKLLSEVQCAAFILFVTNMILGMIFTVFNCDLKRHNILQLACGEKASIWVKSASDAIRMAFSLVFTTVNICDTWR